MFGQSKLHGVSIRHPTLCTNILPTTPKYVPSTDHSHKQHVSAFKHPYYDFPFHFNTAFTIQILNTPALTVPRCILTILTSDSLVQTLSVQILRPRLHSLTWQTCTPVWHKTISLSLSLSFSLFWHTCARIMAHRFDPFWQRAKGLWVSRCSASLGFLCLLFHMDD